MTMYMMTPELHTALIANCGSAIGMAMLKAMQPVSPVAWEHHFDDKSKRLSYCDDRSGFPPRAGAVEIKPLYTPTKD